jgi:NIPSNAP
MNRRNLITAAVALGAPSQGATIKNAIFELRYYRMRNSAQIQRTTDFLGKYYMPAAQRAGFGPMGFFNQLIADQGPFVLVLTSYSSIAAIETGMEKMKADKEFQKGFNEYNSMAELSYIRMESSLLRAFDSIPGIEIPPGDAKRAPRIFELRTYESSNAKASKTKIKMFDDAEINIFRRCGMLPIFFGETLIGRNLPNLTYMLAYDDLAARDKVWKAFAADPAWQKLRATPGLTDLEIVSNISNSILRPLPFSPIR